MPLRQSARVQDLYTRMVTSEIAQPPQALTLEYRYGDYARKIVAVFPVNQNHHDPYGWVGSMSVVCDDAMGILCNMHLGDTELPMTIAYTIDIDFYRPVQVVGVPQPVSL